MLSITIPGEMRGKGRPRFSRRSGRAYTDAKTANAETWVKSCAVDQVGTPLLEGPLRLSVHIGVSIPESWSKTKKARALQQTLRPTGRPDFDNVGKLLSDSLNKIVWRDDSQIVEALISKAYSAEPFTLIQVWQL